jgi:hypothetical protein
LLLPKFNVYNISQKKTENVILFNNANNGLWQNIINRIDTRFLFFISKYPSIITYSYWSWVYIVIISLSDKSCILVSNLFLHLWVSEYFSVSCFRVL